jgi:hypothetical protein
VLQVQDGEDELEGSEADDDEALLAQFGGSDEEDGEADVEQDEDAGDAGDEDEERHRWEDTQLHYPFCQRRYCSQMVLQLTLSLILLHVLQSHARGCCGC